MTTLSVLDAAREAPDRPALVIGPRTLTFADLARGVQRAMAALTEQGAPFRDGWLSIVGTSDPETIQTVLAAIELGQPLALVHPRLTQPERNALIESIASRLHLDLPLSPSLPPPPSLPLALLFSSGTTGRPKGVVLSRGAFLASAEASAANLGWRDDDRWLLGLPIAHVGGLSILTRCLIARRTVVVPEPTARGERLDAATLASEIERHRVTLVSLVPTQLEWLLAGESWRPPPHLRAVLVGGAAARPALLARAADRGVPVLTTYGLTEACSQVTTQAAGTVNRGELGSGAPMKGTEVRIVDGAIQIRGPALLSGYFPGDGTSPLDGEGFLHTDDLGRIDEHGHLHVLGRRSDLIITGGENVHPSEVEGVLERFPGVAEACVFGVPDDTWGQVVAAAIVPAHPGAVDLGALAVHLRSSLAPHRRPRRIALVGSLVTTPAGKLDRRATATRYASELREP